MTTHKLYQAAIAADKVFHDNCVRQFGDAAGDKRYQPQLHDEETRAAGDAMQRATNEWIQACRMAADAR